MWILKYQIIQSRSFLQRCKPMNEQFLITTNNMNNFFICKCWLILSCTLCNRYIFFYCHHVQLYFLGIQVNFEIGFFFNIQCMYVLDCSGIVVVVMVCRGALLRYSSEADLSSATFFLKVMHSLHFWNCYFQFWRLH